MTMKNVMTSLFVPTMLNRDGSSYGGVYGSVASRGKPRCPRGKTMCCVSCGCKDKTLHNIDGKYFCKDWIIWTETKSDIGLRGKK